MMGLRIQDGGGKMRVESVRMLAVRLRRMSPDPA
jgi:hypothetical protein